MTSLHALPAPAPAPAFASPIDAFAHGEYRPAPVVEHRDGRITVDASSPFGPDPDRYHVYGRQADPSSHRLAILRALAGLDDIVSMSYVHGLRDARGWAFREASGPDPVNGFALLREAYETTWPGYDGDVRVPLLWDRWTGRIVTLDPIRIGLDLSSAFRHHATGRVDAYPAGHAARVRAEVRRVRTEITDRLGPAVYDPDAAYALRRQLHLADRLLSRQPHLLGAPLTDADVQLWVTVVRYDAGPNAHGAIGPHLDCYPALWRWARRVYAQPEFRSTTNFAQFASPFAELPDWDAPPTD